MQSTICCVGALKTDMLKLERRNNNGLLIKSAIFNNNNNAICTIRTNNSIKLG